MVNTVFELINGTDNATSVNNSNISLQLPLNRSLHSECITVVFSEMEFLPWDNPENLMSEEAENIVYRIKNNLLVLLFLIGVPANVINMAVFHKQGLGDRVNVCLFSLAFCDGMLLLISVLLHGEQLHLQFTSKEQFGPMATFLANNNFVVLWASNFISTVLSSIIAIERCLCVVNPLKFQVLLRTRTVTGIIVFTAALITGLYFVVAFRYRVGCYYDPVSHVMTTTLVKGPFYQKHKALIDGIYSFFLGFGLPSVEVIVVVVSTVITVVKLRQAVTWRSGASSLMSAKEVALTRVLVCNSIFFIACITPVTLIRFSKRFMPEVNSGRRHHNFYLAGVWLTELFSFINSTFNFFIYYVMGSKFRETMWSLFGRRKAKSAKL